MSFIFLAVPILAASPMLQAFQDSDVDGLRFHRVHLSNGNFIDGQLLKETSSSVLLKLRAGEMTIRRDMINRVEFVKMRDRYQPVIIVEKDKGRKQDETGSKTDEKVDRTVVNVDTPEAIRRKVDGILFRFKNSPGGDDRAIPFQEIAQLGEEASVYLASKVPAFDLKTQDAMAVALININNLKRSQKVDAVLEGYLSHEAPTVRALSASVLAIGASESEKLRMLRPLVQDKDKRVRVTVLSAIGSVEDRAWFDAMTDVSSDPDEDVRSRALRILKNLSDRYELKDQLNRLMVNNLRAPDPGAQRDAISMLSLLGVKENWKDIAPMLQSPEAPVRSSAAQALMNLGVLESGEDVVSAMSTERDRATRGYLAAAVQKLRPLKAVEPLIQWLRDPDEEVQRMAEVTLRTLTGENLGADADKWQDWWDKRKQK